jgi:hypothetical protein
MEHKYNINDVVFICHNAMIMKVRIVDIKITANDIYYSLSYVVNKRWIVRHECSVYATEKEIRENLGVSIQI